MIEFSGVKNDRGEYIQFDILNYLSVCLAPLHLSFSLLPLINLWHLVQFILI